MSRLSTGISFADVVVMGWRLNQTDTDITADWLVSADGTNISVDKYRSHVSKQVDSLGPAWELKFKVSSFFFTATLTETTDQSTLYIE